MNIATFAAGCFWGVEDYFMKLNGVISTCVGYEGGNTENPTYKDVCTNKTNHAEVVQINYDSNIISYDELLDHFFKLHDPTSLNRQGVDIGSQYRSAIFYHNDLQFTSAKEFIDRLNKIQFNNSIVTILEPHSIFYMAEEYHQKYFLKTGEKSCHILR